MWKITRKPSFFPSANDLCSSALCYQHYTQRFWIRLKTEEKYEIVLDKEATKKLESLKKEFITHREVAIPILNWNLWYVSAEMQMYETNLRRRFKIHLK